MKLMLITNDAEVARCGAQQGVDRVFVDLEIFGKVERQGHLDTLISRHQMADVAKIRAAVPQTELLVRLNPLHAQTADEVDLAIRAGADLLMLPMFHAAESVQQFCDLVAGRAGVVPLVETAGAAKQIRQLCEIKGLHEVFIGLNDLHLSLQREFMFQLLADGTIARLAETILAAGLPFGFGGIARIGEGQLPAERILGEHVRLGSRSVILSRTFFHDSSRTAVDDDFPVAIQKVRNSLAKLRKCSRVELEQNRRNVVEITNSIVANRRKRVA